MFSSEEIEDIISQALDGESVKIIDHQLPSHSKEKLGFLGDHRSLEVTYVRKNSSEREMKRFFVKALPQAKSEEQSNFIKDKRIFDQEAAFFNSILPILKKTYSGEDFCPRCFLANERLVVLEDMRLRGFNACEKKIFDAEQLRAAFKAQARLHAASLLAEAELGKCLNDLYPDACVEQIYTDKFMKSGRMELFTELAENFAKKMGRDHRRLYPGFIRGMKKMFNTENNKLPRVISHGDAWPNNYLFDIPRAVMVDFQIVRYGPRMFDVALLMYMGTTREFREREEKSLIETYHQELCDVLEKNNPNVERPSLQDLLDEYEEARCTVILTAVIYYPIIFMDKKELGKYDNDQEQLYKKIVFRDNNDFVLELCEKNSEYGNRIREIVTEAIDYFEKIDVPTEDQNGISE